MTLAQLKTAMQDTVQSSETTFVADLDTMIVNAEKRIYNKVIVPDAKTTATATTTSGTATVAITGDVIAPLRAWMTVSSVDLAPLIRKPMSYMREMFAAGYLGGIPTYYAWQRSSATAATLRLGPTPNSSSYTVNLDFVDGTPPSLVSAETWLSTNYPDVLRKCAIYEAAIFLKMGEMLKVYKDDADEALMSLVQVLGAPQKDEEWPD